MILFGLKTTVFGSRKQITLQKFHVLKYVYVYVNHFPVGMLSSIYPYMGINTHNAGSQIPDPGSLFVATYSHIYVFICGYVWLFVALCGYVTMWLCVALCGYVWLFVALFDSFDSHVAMCLYVVMWLYVATCGFI